MSHLCYWNASRPVGLTANNAGSSSSPDLNSAAWDLTYLPNFFLAWAVVHFLRTKLISLWSFLLPTQRTFSAFKTYFPTSGDLRGYTELCADIPMREGVKGRKRTLKPSEQCSCPPSKCCGSAHLISRNFSVPLHTLQTSCAGYWCFLNTHQCLTEPWCLSYRPSQLEEGVSFTQNLQLWLCLHAPHWN